MKIQRILSDLFSERFKVYARKQANTEKNKQTAFSS